jgi:hypothetical protein
MLEEIVAYQREDSDQGFSDSDESTHDFQDLGSSNRSGKNQVQQLQIEIYKEAIIQAHKSKSKVKDLAIDSRRQFLYSLGTDKFLSVSTSKDRPKRLLFIKCGNLTPKTMKAHFETDRIFVSMRQPILFVFDISSPTPEVLTSVKLENPLT